MQVIPISNDNSQTFQIDLDFYPATINIKSPAVTCLDSTPLSMDIFVDNYPPVYGIPLIPFEDVLSRPVSSGCLPLDIGAIIPIPDINGEVTLSGLAEGSSILTYFNSYETFAMGLLPLVVSQ